MPTRPAERVAPSAPRHVVPPGEQFVNIFDAVTDVIETGAMRRRAEHVELLEVDDVVLARAGRTAEDAGVDLVVAQLEAEPIAEEHPRVLEVLYPPDDVVDRLRAGLDPPAPMLVQPLHVVGGVDRVGRVHHGCALPHPHAERDAAVGGEVDRAVVVPSDLTVNGERGREGVQFVARADPEDGLAYAVAVVVRCWKRRVVGEPDDHPRPFLEPVDGLGVSSATAT